MSESESCSDQPATASHDVVPEGVNASEAAQGGNATTSSSEGAEPPSNKPLMSYFDAEGGDGDDNNNMEVDDGSSSSSLPGICGEGGEKNEKVSATPEAVASEQGDQNDIANGGPPPAPMDVENNGDENAEASTNGNGEAMISENDSSLVAAAAVVKEGSGESTSVSGNENEGKQQQPSSATDEARVDNVDHDNDDSKSKDSSNDDASTSKAMDVESSQKATTANDNNSSNKKDDNSDDSRASSDNNNNNNQNPESPPNSGNLAEAERQAAIAAALSANSSSMSPSVAAGLAKVLALPGIMSDKVGELGDRAAEAMASSGIVAGGSGTGGMGGGGSNKNYPPPPPPRNGSGAQQQLQYQSSPTMVALPPVMVSSSNRLPPPPAGRPVSAVMRPVRFDDVKMAFGELLERERREREVEADEDGDGNDGDVRTLSLADTEESEDAPEQGQKEKVDGEEEDKDDSAMDVDEKTTEENDGKETPAVGDVDNDAVIMGKEKNDVVNAGEEGVGEASSSPEIIAGEKNDAAGSSSTSSEKVAVNELNAKKDSKESESAPPSSDSASEAEAGTAASVPASPPASPSKETSSNHGDDPKIPDSFLRFLLLIARVPIILEEHKKHSPSSSSSSTTTKQQTATKDGQRVMAEKQHASKGRPLPQAARAAARRAYDVLCMARRTYGVLSERQLAVGGGGEGEAGRRRDATTLFFAACAGERIPEEESAEGGEADNASAMALAAEGRDNLPPPSTPALVSQTTMSASTSTPLTATASSMASSASAVFSNVMSKMVTKKQSSLSMSEMGKKVFGGVQLQQQQGASAQRQSVQKTLAPATATASSRQQCQQQQQQSDYEITISQEMLGLTVENVLERTIIRTLLPDGAAKKAGARVGSLIAKVGNVDTSNLTHFETIDELRQSQRPLKLTMREVGNDVLRRAREEMGCLIRGRGLANNLATAPANATGTGGSKPWRENVPAGSRQASGETFDSVLGSRWPSKGHKSSSLVATPPPSRAELMHRAGKDLIRILALLVVGLERELSDLNARVSSKNGEASSVGGGHHNYLSAKELIEAIEITSKILLDYARGHPEVNESRSANTAGSGSKPPFQPGSSSFYPVPPGRVQGKKPGAPGRGRGGGGRGNNSSKSSQPNNSPLVRIGDALSRTRSFLVESSSVTATSLRWEIIDYLCAVLDLDTEMELSEKETSASSSSGSGGKDGGGGSPTNDLGSAGNILKLIVLNCSTSEDMVPDMVAAEEGGSVGCSDVSDSESDMDIRQHKSQHHAGNPFLSVVHRLAASKSTSARVTATSLGTVLWSHLDFPRQLQLRGVITRALHDVEVMVRKSTAAVLHEIAELVFDRRAVPWLVLMCERSMTDPEPQLRAAAMTLTWHLAEHLPNAFLGDASKGSRSLRRLPPRSSPTFMDVYLLQCKLFPVANNLAEDRVASVRLSVAAQCDRLSNALGEHWFSVIIDLLQALLSDGDDRVRSEAILCMPRLVESVIVGTSNSQGASNITVLESLLPLALKIQKDNSSLVRSSLAMATGELLIFLVGLGGSSGGNNEPPLSPGRTGSTSSTEGDSYKQHKKYVDDTLIPILQRLLQDSDPEVTTASLRAVTNASRSGSHRDTTPSTLVPSCSHTTTDNLMDESDDMISLSSHHSHTSYHSERTASTKPVFIPVLSEEQVLRLLPTLSNLATSTQWRVRQSAVEIVPALMGCTRRHETRHEISKLCFRLMNDKVDAVRKTAAECLCLGGSSLARHGEEDGGEWIKNIVIPHLGTCSKSSDSKQRLLCLKMVEIVIVNGLCPTAAAVPMKDCGSPSCDDDESTTSSISMIEAATPLRTILNIAASLTTDNVANIRLNVGRTLGAIVPLLLHEAIDQNRSDVDYCVTTLEKQLENETARPGGGDRDVIYFAQQAISFAEPLLRHMSSTLST